MGKTAEGRIRLRRPRANQIMVPKGTGFVGRRGYFETAEGVILDPPHWFFRMLRWWLGIDRWGFYVEVSVTKVGR